MAEPTKIEEGKYSKQFSSLRYLLGNYFHEDMFDVFDWKGRRPDYQGVIRHFKTQDSPIRNREIPKELREFLALSKDWDEDKLDDVLEDDFGNCLYAPGYGITYREFLEGILEVLEEPMEKTRSEFTPKFIG